MKMKSALKYRVRDNNKAILIYYLIIIAIFVAIFSLVNGRAGVNVIVQYPNNSRSSTISGIEVSTMIFLFVTGLSSFKESFKMYLQNSVSRKTVFKSFVVWAACVGLVMSLIDNTGGFILSQTKGYASVFAQLYAGRYQGTGYLMPYMEGFLWYIVMYLFSLALGFFISILYYRMNKAGKLTVSIGVPVFFLFVFPTLDIKVFNGTLTKTISKILTFVFGLSNGINPYYTVVSFLGFFVILSAFSYLLIRKAAIKD